MEQLSLTNKQLKAIGFVYNRNLKRFTIPVVNGFFYYNPKEKTNKWYLMVTVNWCSDHILLDITSGPHLYSLLQMFRVKFTIQII